MRKIVYGGVCLAMAVIAVLLGINFIAPLLVDKPSYVFVLIAIGMGLAAALLGFFLAPPIGRALERTTEKAVSRLSQLPMIEIMAMVIGLIIGLVIASLVGTALSRIPIVGTYLAIIAVLLLGYIGFLVGYRKREDFASLIAARRGEAREKALHIEKRSKKKYESKAAPKILDTSVIIDGRIADVYRSGFLEGDLIVANFVLDELRHIADSGNNLKRNRGRGGLDCLNSMREEFNDSIVIVDTDYPDVAEVDSKLLRLAQDMQGVVVTNDFNLNKIAQLQGMRVLNINELTNAVKSVVLPGEEMTTLIVKEGKEANQGVAYLDDGTMIVVENGRRYIGKQLQVVVTSILQTPAGRMVFVRPKFTDKGEIIETGA